MVAIFRVIVFISSLCLFSCVPEPITESKTQSVSHLIEGVIDPATESWVMAFGVTPLSESLQGLTEPITPNIDWVAIVGEAGDSLFMVRDSVNRYVLPPGQLVAGYRYSVAASIDKEIATTTLTVIPPPPIVSFGEPRLGSNIQNDFSVLLDVTIDNPLANYAIRFNGLPMGESAVAPCNGNQISNFINASCAEQFSEVEFEIGWFTRFIDSDTLSSFVSYTSDGFADYASIVAVNETNWESEGQLIYTDPVVMPSNIAGASGYISFQNSTEIVVVNP